MYPEPPRGLGTTHHSFMKYCREKFDVSKEIKQHITKNEIMKLPVCIAHSPPRVSGSVHSVLAVLLPETMLQIMIHFCR